MAASRRASARRCSKARVYDKDGQLVTGSFMDYCMPRADDLPSFKVDTTDDASARPIRSASRAAARRARSRRRPR